MHYTVPCTMRGGRRSHCALIDRTGQPPTFSELRNSAISNDWHDHQQQGHGHNDDDIDDDGDGDDCSLSLHDSVA